MAPVALFGVAAEVRAQEPAPPKVAVVVVGDPDQALRDAAGRLEEALATSGRLTLPSDAGLRRALRGEPAPAEDDGLGRVRVERRRLGLGEDRDLPALRALGRMAGAAAIVAVRRAGSEVEAVVIDVSRGAYFEGELSLGNADAETVRRFVAARARAAARGAAAGTDAADPSPPGPAADVDGETGGPAATGPSPTPGEREDEEDSGGILDEWPLFVAGLLLIGAVIVFTVEDGPAAPGPPVLRFVSGGR